MCICLHLKTDLWFLFLFFFFSFCVCGLGERGGRGGVGSEIKTISAEYGGQWSKWNSRFKEKDGIRKFNFIHYILCVFKSSKGFGQIFSFEKYIKLHSPIIEQNSLKQLNTLCNWTMDVWYVQSLGPFGTLFTKKLCHTLNDNLFIYMKWFANKWSIKQQA